MRDTTSKATTTTVLYRTIYMPPKANPRMKVFKSLGRTDSRSLADTWVRNYQVQVLSLTTTEDSE